MIAGFAGVTSGNWQGVMCTVKGANSGLSYWSGKLWANFTANYELAAIVPFPGDLEPAGVTVTLTSVGASAGASVNIVGLEGVIPLFTPPANPTALARASIAATGAVNIVPQLTDGRSYRLWNLEFDASAGAGGSASVAPNAGTLFNVGLVSWAANVAGQQVVSLSYPTGLIIPNGGGLNLNATAPISCGAAVTYDYA